MATPSPDKLVRDPIYKQLNDALRGLIVSGEFKPGEKFLSEREIGERFSVSRATANKALSTLVAEGVLRFKKGVGTFVQAGLRASEIGALISFRQRAKEAGKASTRLLRAEVRSALALEPELVARLALEPGESAYYLERLHAVDDLPLVLERRHVVARRCPELLACDLTGSLHALWTEHYHLEIGVVALALRAVAAPEEDAAALELEAGAPCLLASSSGRLSSGEVLWCDQALQRGDGTEFHGELGAARPAAECNWVILAAALQERRRKRLKPV